MRIKLLQLLMVIAALLCSYPLAAQEILKTFNVSGVYPGTSGSIRGALNTHSRSWIVVSQETQPVSRIVARTLREDGALVNSRVIAQNATPLPQAVDVEYVPATRRYIVVYASPQGLRIQQLQENLQPASPEILIPQSAGSQSPSIVFEEKQAAPFVLWIGAQSNSIRSGKLSNNSVVSVRAVYTAAAGKTIGTLSAAARPGTGDLHLLFSENGTTASLLRLVLNADGLPAGMPVVLQGGTAQQSTGGETVFAAGGVGTTIWASPPAVRFRMLLPNGAFRAPARTMPPAGGGPALHVRAEYEIRNNRIFAVWSSPSRIMGATIHPTSGAIAPPPFPIAQTSGGSGAVEAVSNRFAGKTLVIWEEAADTTGTAHQLRGAIVSTTPEIFPVEGELVYIKVYKPPVISHGYKYLLKYHVRSNRLYRAYVTPETEFEGPRPKVGDKVRMLFEPFRNRFRGYIEEVEVLHD